MGCKRLEYGEDFSLLRVVPNRLIVNKKAGVDREYFAFGETFVEEHSNTDRTPYLFNGKELDEETGLYYFGARYQDPRTSIFLSVDRFAEKYGGWTPYQYTLNNPIRYIEVNGDSVYHKIPGDAQRAASNLNSIYRKKYGIDYDLFSVETREADITKIRTVGDFFFGASTERETVSFVTINEECGFDFTQDEPSTALKAAIMAKTNIEGVVTEDSYITQVKGLTDSPIKFNVPKSLPDFDVNNSTNNWTFGGAWLHELIYHISPLGAQWVKEAGNIPQSNRLYSFFLDFGTDKSNHGAGTNQNSRVTKQYETLKAIKEKK